MAAQRVSHHDKCFGCGAGNPDGLQAEWRLAPDRTLNGSFLVHEGLQGPPGYAHGGIMAAALDEAMSLLVHGLGIHNVTEGFEVRLVWLLDGPHVVQPAHPVPVPTFMKIGIRTFEIAGIIAVPVVVYLYLIRPWRREGEITASGLAVIGFSSMYWQDPLVNYFNTVFVLNSYAINLNSWGSYTPGWRGPNGDHLIVTPVLNTLYLWVTMGIALVFMRLMGWARNRWPHWSNWRLFVSTVALCVLVDLIVEAVWLRVGINSYPGAWPSFTLFAGHHYQVPIMEALLTGPTFWAGMAALLYFRNDRGRTIPERGIDTLSVGKGKRTALRILAFVGAVQVIYLGYNFAFAVTQGLYASPCTQGLYASPWPQDVVSRPYFVNDHCGPGTAYDCPPYRSLNEWLVRPLVKDSQFLPPTGAGH